MALNLLHPPGRLYAQYRAIEDALDYAAKLHGKQIELASAHPDYYDIDVHTTVLAFNLRAIGRKIDALTASFRACVQPGQIGGVSRQTVDLQNALQEYNATVASVDPWDNALHAAANAVNLAFDYFRSLEDDIWRFEQEN